MREVPRLSWPRIAVTAFLVATALGSPFVAGVAAQNAGESNPGRDSAVMRDLRERLGMPAAQRAQLPADRLPALEAAVDPREHYLAPGDELALAIWGAIDTIVPLTVAADGSLIIPTVGIVPAAGVTLAEAADRVRLACASAYPHSEISLSLVRPGMLRIPITGQVIAPGIYEIPSTGRLADLIEIAGGLRTGADTRAVRVTHAAGAADAQAATAPSTAGADATFDLLAWRVNGDAAGNPVLRSGDRVHAAELRDAYRVRGLFPEGEREPRASSSLLDRPFFAETMLVAARAGDTLGFVLGAAGRQGANSAADGIWLSRESDRERRWVTLDETRALEARAGDILEIPFSREWVAVSGSVERPGYYPYLPGQTVADYVNLAGGPNEYGRGGGWKIFSPAGERLRLGDNQPIVAGARIWVPERRWHKFATVLTPLGTAVAVVVSLTALLTK